MQASPLNTILKVLLLFFLVFAGLHFSKPFLVPLLIAGMLAMLFLPLSVKMERKGLSKGVAGVVCVLILAAAIAVIVTIISTQIASFAEDLPKLKENVGKSVNKIKDYISVHAGITPQQQQQMAEQSKSGGGGQASGMVATILGAVSGVLVDTVLVFVYLFLLLFFRAHLKQFILKLVPPQEKNNAAATIKEASKVAGSYLKGLGMMIVMLWIMYGIGFSIVGVENAIFFAVLCGLLEIVPFIGNVTGTGLTVLMALTQGGGSGMIVGILVTYAIVQFLQTYILEPLVVGSEVNINPLFTIIAIVVGELVWGVPGMILAIPMLGIVKVICDHVEPLKPYAFLIGEDKKGNNSSLIDKVKGWFKK